MTLTELKEKFRKLSALEKARKGWEGKYGVSSKQCMHGPNCKLGSFCSTGRRLQEVNILGGLILPVRGTVRQSHKRIRAVRIETTSDTQRIVGLLIPIAAVPTVLQGPSLSLIWPGFSKLMTIEICKGSTLFCHFFGRAVLVCATKMGRFRI
ncbi:hypothetical protein SASPL_121134 [Salvia splendens]|uniref:SBNO alpha/beta domain-containing protein n=1 Tax=Salvia splendens TaxID=180675 RepID=A0A8X8XUC6_SALSN|nr:hypothetical protein SASPL_121134 [Salvia splendens]